jgi:Holliday junction resolvase RusA-like endonuclease
MAKKQKLSKEQLLEELNKFTTESRKLISNTFSENYYIPLLPPTTNKAYFNHKFGRSKTTIANTYQNKVKQYILDNYFKKLPDINPFGLYSISYAFYIHWSKIFNINYPKTKTPYKKRDTDNMIKLLKDSFAETIGLIDDTQIFEEVISKIGCDSEKEEGVLITLTPINLEGFEQLKEHNLKEKTKLYKNYLDFYKKGIKTI